MKPTTTSSLLVLSLSLGARAYLDTEEGAFNVRHYHMVERSADGEIVGRAFTNTYSISDLDRRDDCTTVMACGTAAGCAVMAGQRYCKGKSWEKSFQEAVSQTGANGMKALELIGNSAGRGPVGTIVGMAKTTAEEIIKAKNEKKPSAPAKPKPPAKGANRRGGQTKHDLGKDKKGKTTAKGKGTSKPRGKIHKAAPAKGKSKPAAKGKPKSPAQRSKSASPKAKSRSKAAPKAKAKPKSSPKSKPKSSPKPKPKSKSPPKPKSQSKPKANTAPKSKPKPKAAAPKPKAPAPPKPKAATKPKATTSAKKTKRSYDGEFEEGVMNRRDFEIVERDGNFNFVQRAEYSKFDLVTRDENGELVERQCEMFNGDVTCM